MATKEDIKKAKKAIKETDEAIKADLKLSKSLQKFLEEDTSPEEAKRRVKMFMQNPEKFRDLGTGVPIIKKAKGGVVKAKERLEKLKDRMIKAAALSERYAIAEQEMIEKALEDKPMERIKPLKPLKPSKKYSDAEQKLIEKMTEEIKEGKPVKKAKGGSVLKQATDDRNRTPKRSICRGGGAAMKGVKFTGVK
jgi:hypothetical protein